MASKHKKIVRRKSKDAEIRKRIQQASQILGDPNAVILYRLAGQHQRIKPNDVERSIAVHLAQIQNGRIDPPKWFRTYINLVRKGRLSEVSDTPSMAA